MKQLGSNIQACERGRQHMSTFSKGCALARSISSSAVFASCDIIRRICMLLLHIGLLAPTTSISDGQSKVSEVIELRTSALRSDMTVPPKLFQEFDHHRAAWALGNSCSQKKESFGLHHHDDGDPTTHFVLHFEPP